MLHRRIVSKLIVPLHPGVYTPSSASPSWRRAVMAAVFACGPTAVVSHRAAAELWGMLEDVRLVEVTIPHSRVRSVRGVIVHRAVNLEATRHTGFPISPPMRTLLDLAGVVPEEVVEVALDAAHRRGRIDLARFAVYLDQKHNLSAPGSGGLRRMVAARDPKTPIPTDLETRFFSKLRRGGLPIPVCQHPIRTRNGLRYVDFAYPDKRIGIELDGWASHGNPSAFAADRARQNDIEGLGWNFFRFMWTQVTGAGFGFLLPLADALDLEPVRWRPRRSKSFQMRATRRPATLR